MDEYWEMPPEPVQLREGMTDEEYEEWLLWQDYLAQEAEKRAAQNGTL